MHNFPVILFVNQSQSRIEQGLDEIEEDILTNKTGYLFRPYYVKKEIGYAREYLSLKF